MDKKVLSVLALKKTIERFDILLDYTVLQERSFDEFLRNYQAYKKFGSKTHLIITYRDWLLFLVDIKHVKGQKLDELQSRRKTLEKLKEEEILTILRGGKNFQGVFSSGEIANSNNLEDDLEICILTQKIENAEDLLNNPDLYALDGFIIRRINSYGFLSKFYNRGEQKRVFEHFSQKELLDSFVSQRIPNKSMQVTLCPCTGELVRGLRYGQYALGKVIGRFYDGCHYAINDELSAKIYHADRINQFRFAKLHKMLKKRITLDGICWPIDLLVDSNNRFVGYLFPSYTGSPLQLSVMNRAGISNSFPNWNKSDLVQLAITILEHYKYLNRKNVALGCIDVFSVFVNNPNEVYLANTDYFQVDNYPSLQRSTPFVPPEYINKINDVRMIDNSIERYSIAVLLFMLMLPGKEPYMQRTGSHIENIRAGIFPYAYGERHSIGGLDGQWRFIWSHLPKEIKRLFFQTFQKGEQMYNPENRLSISKWISVFHKYLSFLNNEEYCSYDPETVKIFPNSFKKSSYDRRIVCEICGIDYPDWYMDSAFPKICSGCSRKQSDLEFVCVSCKRKFILSIHEKKHFESNPDWKPQKRCSECKKKRLKYRG